MNIDKNLLETLKAIEEAEQLLKDPNAKKYKSFEELMADVFNEDEEQ